ncbi:hypothetical protein PBRA_006671 [Plasmodiophora brassicae]|nr:hypothetical protein PBRA_006671 [Plasmodiophora brassicae]
MSGIAALFFTLCAIDTFLATQHSYLIVIVVFPLAILELGAASRAKKQHLSGAGALAIFLANIADHVPNAVSISLTVVALVMLGAIGTAYHVARRTAAPGTAVRGHATVGEFLTALTAISILLTAPPTSFVQAIFVVSIWTVVTMALTSWVVWRYDLASNDPVPTGTKHTAALSIGDSISIDNPEGPQGEPSNVTSEGRQSERERHVRLPTFFVPKRTMPVRPRSQSLPGNGSTAGGEDTGSSDDDAASVDPETLRAVIAAAHQTLANNKTNHQKARIGEAKTSDSKIALSLGFEK